MALYQLQKRALRTNFLSKWEEIRLCCRKLQEKCREQFGVILKEKRKLCRSRAVVKIVRTRRKCWARSQKDHACCVISGFFAV
jgi:hypothetical protein